MIVGSDKDKKKEKETKEGAQDEEAMGTLEQLLGGPQNEIRTIGLIGDVDGAMKGKPSVLSCNACQGFTPTGGYNNCP